MRADVRRAAGTVATRGSRGVDPFAQLLAGSGMRIATTLEVGVERVDIAGGQGRGQATAGAAMGRPGQARVVLDAPPAGDDEEGHVVLVEDDGVYHWVFAVDGRFSIEVDDQGPGSADRGSVLGRLGRKIRQSRSWPTRSPNSNNADSYGPSTRQGWRRTSTGCSCQNHSTAP